MKRGNRPEETTNTTSDAEIPFKSPSTPTETDCSIELT